MSAVLERAMAKVWGRQRPTIYCSPYQLQPLWTIAIPKPVPPPQLNRATIRRRAYSKR